jgi:hypothetical protein
MTGSVDTMSIWKGACGFDTRWTLALRNWRPAAVIVRIRALAPYALLELVLPGGSIMALLLWLYRRRKNEVAFCQAPMRLLSFLRLARCFQRNSRPIVHAQQKLQLKQI